MSRVLLVEDQVNVRRSMRLLFERDGHVVSEAATVAEALRMVEATPLDVVVTDVRIDGSDSDGLMLMRELRSKDIGVEVVLITAFGTISDAVEAIKAGAYDYLTKPADPDRLLITIRRAAERTTLAREVRQLRAQIVEDRIVAASREMQRVLATVSQLANTDSTVLITGESGTGKELIARALYEESPRRHGRFVPINCGAMAEALLESELFGHRKGSFTGAVIDKKGLLEEADGGVLFLDEIGEMPLPMQVRLLRFLQGGEVRRVGDTTTRQVDVRLIAATHRDLETEVAQGRFRQDFFYRINVVGVRIPPLRERTDDIDALADFFLRRYSARLRRPIVGFAAGAIDLLKAHPWPGNARELENAIERAVNLASGPLLTPEDLPASVFLQAVTSPPAAIPLDPDDERGRLLAALEEARWNQSRAATRLGISRTTLWRKMREHRIET
jgi:two-component system, NtrC family, response regulator AtoC